MATPSTAGDMPTLGLGTWENTDPGQCATSVETALEMGYRHIDTAQAYGNEAAVGDGLAAADVPRDDVFLATKVWITNLSPEDVRETTMESLDRLGTDYVDLLYVHWPAGEYRASETMPAFEDLADEGYIRHIGVSNFEPQHLETAMEAIDAEIFANQVEIHPFLQQQELVEYAADAGFELVGYSPLARGDVLESETLQEIAVAHNRSPAQVALAWLRQRGVTAIPKATSEAHIHDNWESRDLSLTDEDLSRIENLDAGRRKVHPEFGPDAWA